MILTINVGSSSIKFALFKAADTLQQILHGAIESIGASDASFSFYKKGIPQNDNRSIGSANHGQAAAFLIEWLEEQEDFSAVRSIGHRIVHGMEHTMPEVITPELLTELKQISSYDPEHLPNEIMVIELFAAHWPELKQIACFDTSFHNTMPKVAKTLAIPRRYYDKGVRRYGFHGLSYAYLLQELENIAGYEASHGKVILAHLGSGASLAAVKDGESVDTTMGFTPASGLPMSTRSGDLDPGVAWYLMQFEKLNSKQFNHLINHESGLLGVSETSADMRELMELEDTDSRAAEAIELFCYQAKKSIGSFTAVLDGLEILVFAGGIGEHSPEVRSKICDGLSFLGIELDEIRNMNNEGTISSASSKVPVYMIKTNEEIMIARLVYDLVNPSTKNE